jgi:hypothetical protein
MRRIPLLCAAALVAALLPSAALAQAAPSNPTIRTLSDEALLRSLGAPPPDARGRQDVREVSLPRPPQGPATPQPFCTPSAPYC